MPDPAPTVSVLIANWNGCEVLADCLRSLFEKTSGVSFETIVVDDASTDHSVQMLKSDFPGVQVVLNEKNLGFVRSNNRGLRAASGRYVFLLNTDTIILNNALKILSGFLDSHPDVGACGGWLRNRDLTSQISYGDFPSFSQALVDAFFLNDLFPGAHFPNRGAVPKTPTADPCEVSYICGADLLVRRELVNRIGLFDEQFQAYCEETDLCYRIKRVERLKVYFVPEAQIVHLGGASYGKLGKRQLQLQYDSYDKFLTKHHGNFYSFFTRLLYAWHYAVKSIVRYVYYLAAGRSEKERQWVQFLKAMYTVKYSLMPRLPVDSRQSVPHMPGKM